MAEVNHHLINKKDTDHRQRKSAATSFFSGQGAFFFQPKLTVGSVDDAYEREADAVAEQVMRMPGNTKTNSFFPPVILPITPFIQLKCAACEEEEKVQRKETNPTEMSTSSSSLRLLAHKLTHVVQQSNRLQRNTIQRQSVKPDWCVPFMDLVRYEDVHGKLGVLMTYNPFAFDLLPKLNHNIPSIYGDVDVDWMLRLALSQYLTVFASIFSPSVAELIGMSSANALYLFWKPFWNTLRATAGYAMDIDPWKDYEYASVFEEANRNAPMVIRIWFHRDVSLRDIFAPAITLCEAEEKVQRKATASSEAPAEVHEAIHSGGQAIDKGTRSFMENQFGYDFSQVKIHTGAIAAKSANAINALAYTSGNHIVFNEGQYAPETDSGKRLLAHELTHVVQQTPVIQRFTHQHFTNSGCSPDRDQNTLQADFDRAEGYVNAAITAMQASPISDSTRRSIRWYFHSESDTLGHDILNNLQNISTALRLSDNLGSFACQPAGGACRSNTLAYVQPGNVAPGGHAFMPINLCPLYFGDGPKARAESLIHEAAHLVGMSVRTDDVYDHTHRFRSLPASEALLNADSYALFASSITEGVPIGFVFSAGGTGGALLGSPGGEAGWFASAFVDATLQHPRLYVFNPSLRFSIGLMGLPATGERGASAPTTTVVYSLLPGFRLENPRPSGGTGFFSLRGGPTLNLGQSGVDFGAEVGVEVGYHWRWVQFSAGASYNFDPTAPEGSQHLVRLGPTISFDFSRSD